MMAQSSNYTPQEAEAAGSQIQGLPVLQWEILSQKKQREKERAGGEEVFRPCPYK
jgi:hypothetical protein